MTDKILNIKERVLKIAENQEGNKQAFFRKIGVSYGNFTGKSKETDLNSNTIKDILLNYPNINPVWLLMGDGEMLIQSTSNSNVNINTNTNAGGRNIDVSGDNNTIGNKTTNKQNVDNDLENLCKTQKIEIKFLNEKIDFLNEQIGRHNEQLEQYKDQITQFKEIIQFYKER